MFKKLFIFISVLSVLIGNPVYADELQPPTQPDITDKTPQEANKEIEQYNSEVDTYNEEVDKYNAQVDSDYEQAVVDYEQKVEEVTEHNKVEDEKVAEVEAHNAEEDEKLAKSQEELAIVESKVEADAPGNTIENFTESAEDLPTDWSDTTEELHTIEIEEAEEKSGEEVKIINLHLYLDGEYVPSTVVDNTKLTNDHFELTKEVKDNLLFAEWEVATFDLNDRVTVKGEGEDYKNNTIRHDGKNYRIQAYDARHVRNIEDHTQGAWIPGSIVEYNCNTAETGWGYDFDTMEGKGGETYTFEFNEVDKTQSYYYNGKIMTETVKERTIDGSEPKNILSIFTYIFQKLWNEPVEYEPDYQEYTPDYMEQPEEPVKGEYLEKLDHIDLVDIPEEPEPVPDDPTPTPPELIIVPDPKPTPTPVEPEVEPTIEPEPVVEPEPTVEPVIDPVEIPDEPTPQAAPIGSWALFNLICSILTGLAAIIKLIVFKRKEEDEEEEKEINTVVKNSYLTPISSIILTVCSFYLFFITEDMRLPMVIFDKFSPIMFILFIIGILLLFTKLKKEKEEQKQE